MADKLVNRLQLQQLFASPRWRMLAVMAAIFLSLIVISSQAHKWYEQRLVFNFAGALRHRPGHTGDKRFTR